MNMSLNSLWTASQVMKSYPQTAAVFMALKTDCVGCPLSRFCTLDEVANSYTFPVTRLLEKLHEAIHSPHP